MERRSTGRDEGRSRGRDEPEGRGEGRRRGGRDEPEGRGGRGGRDEGRRSSGRSGGYQYEGRSREEMRKRSTQGANEFDKFISDKIQLFKPNDGDNTIRILPPTWQRPKHYGLDIYVHYGVGPDRQAYLCLHKMADEANAFADRIEKDDPSLAEAIRESAGHCPICAERQQAMDDGDEKYAKEIEAKRRVLVYLIDRDKEKEGLKAWSMPWTVDRDLCTVSVDKKSGEVLPIDHPTEGYDVMFEKKGAKDRTEYIGMQIARRESDLGNESWLDDAIDLPLPDALVFFPSDHIAKAFGGVGAHKERKREDGDDHGVSSSRRGRDDDNRGGRGSRDAPADPDYSWEQVHEMTSSELDDLVDSEKLKLDPNEFESDEELADAICEEMGIKKPGGRRRVVDAEPAKEPEGRSRLASMRERRERGDR